MKLIKPSFEIWEQPSGLEGVYKQIEGAGRVCYKSEDKITEDSAKSFVDRMIASGHGAMLEHGTVYLRIPIKVETSYRIDEYNDNPYTKTKIDKNLSCYYISTNYRVLVEHGWLDDLKYLCEPTEYHAKRVTVHFVCDRGVSHEFVRHRVFSFAQESTRYCNYSKSKFNGGITFITPCWLDKCSNEERLMFLDYLKKAEGTYIDLTKGNMKVCRIFAYGETEEELVPFTPWQAQWARAVLPNALKTELVVTGFASDWNHFFDLRAKGTTGAPHPQAKELAEPLMKEFIARKYINN